MGNRYWTLPFLLEQRKHSDETLEQYKIVLERKRNLSPRDQMLITSDESDWIDANIDYPFSISDCSYLFGGRLRRARKKDYVKNLQDHFRKGGHIVLRESHRESRKLRFKPDLVCNPLATIPLRGDRRDASFIYELLAIYKGLIKGEHPHLFVAEEDIKATPFYGSSSIDILVPEGIKAIGNDLGHNKLYIMTR